MVHYEQYNLDLTCLQVHHSVLVMADGVKRAYQPNMLTLCILGKISADDILKYFPYFSKKIGSQ